jgi:hypothetical protein
MPAQLVLDCALPAIVCARLDVAQTLAQKNPHTSKVYVFDIPRIDRP